jgi:hypothetical protein
MNHRDDGNMSIKTMVKIILIWESSYEWEAVGQLDNVPVVWRYYGSRKHIGDLTCSVYKDNFGISQETCIFCLQTDSS